MFNKLVSTIKGNFTELYVSTLLFFGLPLVAAIYFTWKEALTVFIVTQIVVGLLAMRKN